MRLTTYKYICLLPMLISAMLFCSCAQSDMTQDGDGNTVTMGVTLNVDKTMSRAISGDNENTISDITLLVFDSDGKAIGYSYSTTNTSSPTVATRVAEGCTVYAIANTGSASTFEGVTTLSELQAKYLTTSADNFTAESTTSAVMSGCATSVSTTTNPISIALKHLCAKTSVTITPATGIYITGYRLCHVPNKCYYTEKETMPTETTYGDCTAYMISSPTATGTNVTATLYSYENLAGTVDACTLDSLRTSANAPTNASYLEVYATNGYWTSTYRFYLGGIDKTNGAYTADPTNFNVYRNRSYKMNVTINGSGENDARVTLLEKAPQFLFSDGTWGPYNDYVKAGTTPIAIIFSRSLSATDRAAGFVHGYAMALKDASGTFAWENNGTDVSELTNVNTTSALIADKDGRTESNVINSTTYPAAYAATTSYKSTVSAPSGTSGWYLPSIGQWFDICVNLGGMSSSAGNNNYYDGGSYLYWNGQSSNCATNINNKLQSVGEKKYTKFAEGNIFWSSSE